MEEIQKEDRRGRYMTPMDERILGEKNKKVFMSPLDQQFNYHFNQGWREEDKHQQK